MLTSRQIISLVYISVYFLTVLQEYYAPKWKLYNKLMKLFFSRNSRYGTRGLTVARMCNNSETFITISPIGKQLSIINVCIHGSGNRACSQQGPNDWSLQTSKTVNCCLENVEWNVTIYLFYFNLKNRTQGTRQNTINTSATVYEIMIIEVQN